MFEASCANCYSADGKKLDFLPAEYGREFVFNLTNGNPWELVHKVRFGQPDGALPHSAVKGYVLKDVADILAYAFRRQHAKRAETRGAARSAMGGIVGEKTGPAPRAPTRPASQGWWPPRRSAVPSHAQGAALGD